ncbi:MAG: OmpA family protein [Acidobacteria bacterium]|nr:OmpA family protein [Acidobacteriota bacterium]MBS1866182.1 OmpA family protein [Acidobacteriota bacterium]
MVQRISTSTAYSARTRFNVRLAALALGLMALLGFVAASTYSQTPAPAAPVKAVSRTTKAINYRRSGTTLKILFHGTDLMQQASGEAKVENKGNRVEIDAKFEGLEDATKFGLEYLTYVLWAISPQGRAVNLGEVEVKNGKGQVKAISDMQTFGMIVTVEPYFAVTQPGDEVVAENSLDAASGGETIEARYELLARGVYSSSNTKIENAIFGIDRKTPIELFQARNAVRIARNAGAEKYAAPSLAKAGQQLQSAEDLYRQKRDKKSVIAAARDAVQTAEEARVISVKQKAEEEAQAKAAAEKAAAEAREAKARQDAADEAKRRADAEQARQAAEAAKADAERLKAEAQQAAAEAAKAKEEAEKARAAALADQQAALEQKRAAEADAVMARAAAAKAEQEKADLRAQLLGQLNAVLQTQDSARGLIVNMSDVLFDTGSYTLRPAAREKLAKISGILLAHPGLTLQIEGHTDSVGTDEFNQRLSEQRAGSVLDFLAQQGVPEPAMTSRGFGKTQPVASNDTVEGRQKNRRVELVVNGEAIGGAASAK